MKKGLFILALWPILLVALFIYAWHAKSSHSGGASEKIYANTEDLQDDIISEKQLADTEDLHDLNVLKEHFANINEFEQWYNQLEQKDKNLVLVGTVEQCQPELTNMALKMGGDVNTKGFVISITSGHDEDSTDYVYAYNDEDIENFLNDVMQDGMKRSEQALKEESCGHTFSTMGVKYDGIISLLSLGVVTCRNSDKNTEMLQLLINNGQDINYISDMYISSLSEAISSNKLPKVKWLLQKGADFSKTYALSRLIEVGYSEDNDDMWNYITNYLKTHKLSKEAETDAFVYSQLNHDYRMKDKMAALDLHPYYDTTAAKEGLVLFAQRGEYELMQDFIEHGVDINYQDKYGRTALFYVADDGSPRNEDIIAVRYLLNHGADANIKDGNGKTAFDGCVQAICQLNPEITR